jgi:transposase
MGASFASRVAHVTRCSRSQSLTRPVPVCGFLLGCCRRKPRTPNSPNKRHSMHRRYGRSRRYSCPCLTTVFKVERASASKGRVRVRLEVLSGAPDGHGSPRSSAPSRYPDQQSGAEFPAQGKASSRRAMAPRRLHRSYRLQGKRGCAMTSRTKSRSGGRNLGGIREVAPCDLEQRRQLAVERYLDGDPIEVICQEIGCAKSWLYKWKHRYQATEPEWATARSRRPKTTPSKTPETVEAEIVRLHQALSPDASGTVSARVIRDHLGQHGVDAIPSMRTIARILNRRRQGEASQSVQS